MNRYERYRLKDLEGYRKRKREWARTPEQRKKRAEYQKKWYWANHEKALALARNNHHRNKHKYRHRNWALHLKREFNLTPGQYAEMLAAQSGVCAICQKPPTTRRLHVDHCHATGRVRGLLCSSCNGRLGWLEMYRSNIDAYPI